MNVYEKLNLARVKFQSSNVKESGKNSFAGYTYYQLSDILPRVNEICSELKVSCVVTFDKDIAKLDFIDSEKPEDKITFTSPMSEATLKGCYQVQNLGAVETYIKRYLYQNCFEIVESDILDFYVDTRSEEEKKKTNNQPVKQAQKTENKPVNKPEVKVFTLTPEQEKRYQELTNGILDYINTDILTGDYQRKAEYYINIKDVASLENTLAWCVGEYNKRNANQG